MFCGESGVFIRRIVQEPLYGVRVAKVLGIKKNFFAKKKIFFKEIKFFLRSFNLAKMSAVIRAIS